MSFPEGQPPPLQRALTAPPCRGRGAPPARPPPPKAAPRGISRTAAPLTSRGAPPPQPGAAGPPLRPLFWAKLAQAPADSLWDEAPPPAAFDAALLERRFALATGVTRGAPQRGRSFDEPR